MPKFTRDEVREKKMRFGLWLATPPQARDGVHIPKTQEKMAEQLGVVPEVLPGWKEDPIVKEAKQNAVSLFLSPVLWSVLEKTKDAAINGNAQDRRLFFQLAGHLQKEKRGEKSDKDTPREVNISIEQPKPKNIPAL